jgi:hypothetical protein
LAGAGGPCSFKPSGHHADAQSMPFLRSRVELASAACFVLFAVLALTVSSLVAAPFFVVGVLLTLRARALRS